MPIHSDPCIKGQHGHAYAVCGTLDRPKAPGFAFHLNCHSARAWTAAKAALRFAEVTGDGDEEGALFMDRLPTPAEAATIRRYLGVRAKRQLGDDARAALITRLRSSQEGGSQPELLPSGSKELHP